MHIYLECIISCSSHTMRRENICSHVDYIKEFICRSKCIRGNWTAPSLINFFSNITNKSWSLKINHAFWKNIYVPTWIVHLWIFIEIDVRLAFSFSFLFELAAAAAAALNKTPRRTKFWCLINKQFNVSESIYLLIMNVFLMCRWWALPVWLTDGI